MINFDLKFYPKVNFFIGSSIFHRFDGSFISSTLIFLISKLVKFDRITDGISFISDFFGRVTALEIGLLPGIILFDRLIILFQMDLFI